VEITGTQERVLLKAALQFDNISMLHYV